MGRITQKVGTKGSQMWLQLLINRHPTVIENHLRPVLDLNPEDKILWHSPLAQDEYSEYRDKEFLKRVSTRLQHRSLASFWPNGGPVWDGLGTTSRDDVILVEAKSHISELASKCQAREPAKAQIQKSLKHAAEFYGAAPHADWLNGYYQYANRLAHLYLMRHLNGIPAWLCFVYFVNDSEMSGPKSVAEWRSAIATAHSHLGLGEHSLTPFIVDLFIDVAELTSAVSQSQCSVGS